jgi:tricarboxylate carrier
MDRSGNIPNGVSRRDLYEAKIIYDSAYHPDTGEKMNLIGRMSFQVPGGMVILGAMLVYYRTSMQVLTIQWINQSFNALVNYTNRNANSTITNRQIATAYVGATTGAVGVSIFLNSLVKGAPAIIGKWVPFVAVAAANCINIPVMRQRELMEGVAVTPTPSMDVHDKNELGKSRIAAAKGIMQVATSRIFMTIPTLLLLPVLMSRLELRFPQLLRSNLMSTGVQTVFCGLLLCFAVPLGCSLFPQQSSISFNRLERKVQNDIRKNLKGQSPPNYVYYNKGL